MKAAAILMGLIASVFTIFLVVLTVMKDHLSIDTESILRSFGVTIGDNMNALVDSFSSATNSTSLSPIIIESASFILGLVSLLLSIYGLIRAIRVS